MITQQTGKHDAIERSNSYEGKTIQQLQADLTKKDLELTRCFAFIKELTEVSKQSLKALAKLDTQLKSTKKLLKKSAMDNDAAFMRLLEDNTALKLSNDVWVERALKLEAQLMYLKESNKG
jgi:CRISPR/Cas system CSM-associated protein Csm4 (group 5 of RAMP superfamily)